MIVLFFLALVFLASFITTTIVLPFFIQRMRLRNIVGKDINKLHRPEVAEMGGTVVLLGFVFAMMAALFIHAHLRAFPDFNLLAVLAAMLTIVLVGLVGIVDDLIGWKKGIRQYQHALFPIFAALPLMVLPATIGNTGVDVPFIGLVNFGIWYSLILVPLAVTGASNATNMLAGLNGLEAGLGFINAITLLIIAAILGEIEVVIIMLGLMGALIAFMRFNWFPAKIFPGDSLTLMVGAGIAAAVIIGNMEKIGLLLFIPYFVEFILKARRKFQGQSFGVPQENGTLHAPAHIDSLTHVAMRLGKGRLNEQQVVMVLLGLQVVVAIITFALFYANFSAHPFSPVRGLI